MIRITGGRRLPLTALAVVVAAGTAFAGAAPAQAATTPAPAADSSTAAAIRIPAPRFQSDYPDFGEGASIHGLVLTDLSGIADTSGLRYEYRLDGAGPWLSDGTGYVSDSAEVYIPATPGPHTLVVRIAGTVGGTTVVSAASASVDVRSSGGTLEYTPEIVTDGPSVTFRWDLREALNGTAPEDADVMYRIGDGEEVNAEAVGSVTVTPGYGKSVAFDLTFGPNPDAWRYLHVIGTTADAPGAKKLTSSSLPVILGTVEHGSTLSVRTGTWQPAPVTLSYQWFRDGVRLPGETGPTYKVWDNDLGGRLTVAVRGEREGYVPVVRTSAPTKVIPRPTVTAGTPRITGNPVVGRTLTAQPGVWKPSSLELGYQWKRDGKAISGATAKTYTLTAADRGHTVTVVVSGVIYLYDRAAVASAGVTVR